MRKVKFVLGSAILAIALFFSGFASAADPCDAISGSWSGTWRYWWNGAPQTFGVSGTVNYGGGHIIADLNGSKQSVHLTGTCSNGTLNLTGFPGISLSGYVVGTEMDMTGLLQSQYKLEVTLNKTGSTSAGSHLEHPPHADKATLRGPESH